LVSLTERYSQEGDENADTFPLAPRLVLLLRLSFVFLLEQIKWFALIWYYLVCCVAVPVYQRCIQDWWQLFLTEAVKLRGSKATPDLSRDYRNSSFSSLLSPTLKQHAKSSHSGSCSNHQLVAKSLDTVSIFVSVSGAGLRRRRLRDADIGADA